MTKALIFDFDGTIVDTETPALDSAIDVWREHGAELDVEWWLTTIGSHRKRSWVSVLADEIGVALDEGEVLERRRVRKDAITDRQPVLPGVAELIMHAREQGTRLAVGSSSEHEWVDRHLHRVELFDHFDHVVCRDDVGGRAKPAPDVFLRAVELLEVDPKDVVVIEDSPNGLEAARRAGLAAVVVPNPLMRHLGFPARHQRFDALDQEPAELLLELLFSPPRT